MYMHAHLQKCLVQKFVRIYMCVPDYYCTQHIHMYTDKLLINIQ